MPTLNGTLVDAGGAALASTSISFTRLAGAGVSGAAALSVDTATATTDEAGDFTRVLTGGTWQMRWYTNEGLSSTLHLGMPSTGGPYELEDIAIDPSDPIPSSTAVWYSTVEQLLAAVSTTWVQARTFNTVAGDGVRAGWDRVLKSSSEAASIAANGDSILETDDGLAYAVRSWISL